MCGIAGLFDPTGARPDANRIASTFAALQHRGPDGKGMQQFDHALLLHTRLSIIDVDAGQQPLANEDGTVWVTFNGEIFNYIELRAQLSRLGHRFSTRSDTETLVHAYEEWGDDFVSRLNGQFAFALWDARRDRLLLARDRAGIRPLFHVEVGETFYFASEVRALRAVSGLPLQLDPRGLAEVFTFWSTVGDRTVFQNVRSLPAGHVLVLEKGRPPQKRCYWDWSMSPAGIVSGRSRAQATEELRALLEDAVALQLRADVPVGAYLSGGLDSSGLIALVRRNRDIRLRTFSVTFEDREFDESGFQREIVEHFATDHSAVRCSTSQIADLFPEVVRHAESPLLRTAPAALLLLSRHVRDSGFKVALTGEGADEVFGGYDLFKEAAIRRFWARHPDSTWRPALFARMYPYLRNSPVANAGFSRAFFGQDLLATDSPFYGHMTRWSTTRRAQSLFSHSVRSSLAGWDPRDELAATLPRDFAHWAGLARDQYVEISTLLHGYLLSSQGDRMAMAGSIETRMPYLDHRVIEFANRLPATMKLRGLREKILLRDALRPLLPPRVGARPKQPYRAPDVASFFHDGRAPEYVEWQFGKQRLLEAGIFDPAAANRLFEKCRAGKAIGFADNMAFVGLLSTMLLEEQLVRERNVM